MKIVTIPILVLLICSCSAKDTGYREVKDDSLTVQFSKLPDDTSGSALSFRARIVPSKLLAEGLKGVDKTAMIYEMDSSFYLQQGTTKTYAALVQPIANGVNNTFEYLIEFEKAAGAASKLVYQDKYFTYKTYSVETEPQR